MKKRLLLTGWLAGALYSQTVINGNRKILGQWDASVSTGTIPFSVGTLANLPATCSVGQMFFANDAAAGRNLQSCVATNTWMVVGYRQGTTAALPVVCVVGDLYFATDAAAGSNLYACGTANTWTRIGGASVGAAAGDLSGSYPNPTVSAINGTSVPVNAAGDQVLTTTGPKAGTWSSLVNCPAGALQYSTATHAFSCNTLTAGGDLSGAYPALTVSAINGTSVPVNAAGDQVLTTTGPKAGTWSSLVNCPAGALQYSTATHAFNCGALAGGGGTVTHTAGLLAAGAIAAGNGGADIATPSSAMIDSGGNMTTPGSLTTGSGSSLSGTLALSGLSSGTVTQTVSPDAGTWTFKWPTAAASAHQWLTTDPSGSASFTQPVFGDIGGVLAPAQLPGPGVSSLGGVQSLPAVAHQWVNAISTSGVPGTAQPADADIAFSDVTTGNVSSAAHGYAPKTPNDATKFLNGAGIWSVPPGAAGMTNPMTTAGDLIVGGSGGAPLRLAAAPGYPHWTGGAWQFDTPSGSGATIPSVTNLIAGTGTGNGADSGIAPSNVPLLNGTNAYTGYNNFSAGRFRLPEATFGSAPSSPISGQEFVFTDASAVGTCSGGGAAKALCRWNGSAWEALGGGGASGASYYQTMIGAGSPGSGSNSTSRMQRAAMQARDNLSFDDDGTNTILNFTTLDARVVNFDEEFFGAALTNGSGLWQNGWQIANIAGTSTFTQVAGGDTWPNLGVAALGTGATSGNGLTLSLSKNTGELGQLGALGSNAGWGALWIAKISSTVAIQMRIGIGVVDSVGTFDRNGMMGLRYDSVAGDTNFQFFVRGASGNDVIVDTGVAADTNFHTPLIYSTVAGTIRMSLDGGTEKTFCASGCDGTVTIPTTNFEPIAQVQTATSATKTLYVDAFKFKARVATGTANKRN